MSLQTHRFRNTVKEFETVAMTCQYLDDSDKDNLLPISLDGINITAHANSKSGKLIDKLTISVLDSEQGTFMMKPTLDRLPVGTIEIDICLEKNGSIVMSETFSLHVKKAETNPYL